MVDANHGWRMAGDRGRRWDVADGDRSARGRSSRSACTGSRSRCRRATSTATRGCGPAPRCGSRRARWCAAWHEARDLVAARRRRRRPARRRARGRHRRLPADRGARRPVRPDVLAAHVVERARAGREPAPGARRLDVPVRRGPARPARLERRAARLAARRRRAARSRADGTVGAAARARARRRRPTSTRWRRTASHEDPRRRPARLQRAARRVRARARAAARAASCSCAWPPPACATPTCTSPTATSAPAASDRPRPRGRGRRRGRGGGRRRTSRPGDPVAFCFVPSCGALRAPAPPAGATSARSPAPRVGGHAARRDLAAAAPRRPARRSTSTSSPASPSGLRRARRVGRADPGRAAALAGVAARLRGRHRRRRGAQRGAGRDRRERLRDRLRRRRPPARRGGAAGGRRADRRRGARPGEARARAGARRHRRGRRAAPTAVPRSWRSPPAASTTPSRRSARPQTIRLAWDVLRRGRDRHGRRHRARRRRRRAARAGAALREGHPRQLLRLGRRRGAARVDGGDGGRRAASRRRRRHPRHRTSTGSRRRSGGCGAARARAPWRSSTRRSPATRAERRRTSTAARAAAVRSWRGSGNGPAPPVARAIARCPACIPAGASSWWRRSATSSAQSSQAQTEASCQPAASALDGHDDRPGGARLELAPRPVDGRVAASTVTQCAIPARGRRAASGRRRRGRRRGCRRTRSRAAGSPRSRSHSRVAHGEGEAVGVRALRCRAGERRLRQREAADWRASRRVELQRPQLVRVGDRHRGAGRPSCATVYWPSLHKRRRVRVDRDGVGRGAGHAVDVRRPERERAAGACSASGAPAARPAARAPRARPRRRGPRRSTCRGRASPCRAPAARRAPRRRRRRRGAARRRSAPSRPGPSGGATAPAGRRRARPARAAPRAPAADPGRPSDGDPAIMRSPPGGCGRTGARGWRLRRPCSAASLPRRGQRRLRVRPVRAVADDVDAEHADDGVDRLRAVATTSPRR